MKPKDFVEQSMAQSTEKSMKIEEILEENKILTGIINLQKRERENLYSKLNEINNEKTHENCNFVMKECEDEPEFNDMDENIIECSVKRLLDSNPLAVLIPNDCLETVVENDIKLIIQKEQKSQKNDRLQKVHQILKSVSGDLFSVILQPPIEKDITVEEISLISSKSLIFITKIYLKSKKLIDCYAKLIEGNEYENLAFCGIQRKLIILKNNGLPQELLISYKYQ